MEKELDLASARGVIYKQLSRGFLYPREEFQSDLAVGSYQKFLFQAADQAGFETDVEVPRLQEQELASDYVFYFDIGNHQPPCPPYGGIYLDKDKRNSLLVHLSEMYKNFGLDLADNPRELQDHLSVELEFMYFLCFKEVRALEQNERNLAGYRRAQREFLQHHLNIWFPRFADLVEEKCQNEFYRNLAAWCLNFIDFDSKRLEAL